MAGYNNALNTDIVLKLSADNGSNLFNNADTYCFGDFATGIKMAKVNDLSVTAGTQLKYKINLLIKHLALKKLELKVYLYNINNA